jgi:hypothetical protein
MTGSRNVALSNHRYLWAIGTLGAMTVLTLSVLGYRAEMLMPMIPCLILLAYSFMRLASIVRGHVASEPREVGTHRE